MNEFFFFFKGRGNGTTLEVKWSRLRASTAGGTGSLPGRGTKIRMPRGVAKNSKNNNRKEGAGLRGLTWEDIRVRKKAGLLHPAATAVPSGRCYRSVRATIREGRTRWAPISMQTPQPGHPVGALELRWASLHSWTGSPRDTILPHNLMPPAYSPCGWGSRKGSTRHAPCLPPWCGHILGGECAHTRVCSGSVMTHTHPQTPDACTPASRQSDIWEVKVAEGGEKAPPFPFT